MKPAIALITAAVYLALAGCQPSTQQSEQSSAASVDIAPNPAHPPRQNSEPDEADEVLAANSGVKFVEVTERFLTPSHPDYNVDSPALWQGPEGQRWLIATAKGSHALVIYDGDSGAQLQVVGEKGAELGQFDRPNGVFVIDDRVFVVERDNRRVQVLTLPKFEPLGSFGQAELSKPYGLWLHRADGGYEVMVSDAYMSTENDDLPPAPEQLGRRYQRYQLTFDAQGLHSASLGGFGAQDAAGAIRIPESLWGDEVHDRLLLAEEDQADGTRIKVYDMALHYTGQDIGRGLFKAQAEGIALQACANGKGYWITTDQFKDRSVFHLFDRQSLQHLGAFGGKTTANTDGVWFESSASLAFPSGVFYAVHDDQAVAAFDWADVLTALELPAPCADAD